MKWKTIAAGWIVQAVYNMNLFSGCLLRPMDSWEWWHMSLTLPDKEFTTWCDLISEVLTYSRESQSHLLIFCNQTNLPYLLHLHSCCHIEFFTFQKSYLDVWHGTWYIIQLWSSVVPSIAHKYSSYRVCYNWVLLFHSSEFDHSDTYSGVTDPWCSHFQPPILNPGMLIKVPFFCQIFY